MRIKLTGSQIDNMSNRVLRKIMKAYGDVVADMEERNKILDLLCLAQRPIMSLLDYTGDYGLKHDNTEYGTLHVILRHVSNTFFKIVMKRYPYSFGSNDTPYRCSTVLGYILLLNRVVNENHELDLIEDLTNVALSLLCRLDLDIIENSLVYGWDPDDTDLLNLVNKVKEPTHSQHNTYGTKDTDKIHAIVGDHLLELKCLIDNQAYTILDRIIDVNNDMINSYFRSIISDHIDQVPTLHKVMKENEELLAFVSKTPLPLLEMLTIIVVNKNQASKEKDVYTKIATEVLELFKDLSYSIDYSVEDKVTIKMTVKGKEYLRTYSYDQLL